MNEQKKNNGKDTASDVNGRGQLPKAPDGGWGWMVVFVCFMVHVLNDGVSYSFGVYVEDFVDYFDCNMSEVGTLGSLIVGVTWGSGPIASMLINKFGCKFVSILGAVIAAVGFIMSLFAPNIYFMYFSFGVVAGLGLGLAYMPAVVMLSFYFEKKRSMAMGMAVCGSGIGTFIFAPITEALLNEYGWKGTVLIEAGLLLNIIPFGLLLRPLSAPIAMEVVDIELHEHTTKDALLASDESYTRLNADSNVQSSPVETETGTRRTHSEFGMTRETERSPATADAANLNLVNIPNDSSVQFHQSKASTVEIVAREDAGGQLKCCGVPNTVWNTVGELIDFRLLVDPVFVLFALSNLMTSVGFCVPYIFMPVRGVSRGLSESQAAWLISSIGISNTIGRVVFGYIADFKCVNRLVLYTTAMLICGLTSILSCLCYNFVLMLLYCFSFGLLIGINICLTPIVVVDLLGLAKFSNAYGLILLACGIGAVVGPPIAGGIFDITNDYDNSFYMMGACIATSGLLLCPILLIQRFKSKRRQKSTMP